ncbi:MAG: hypothetical protein J3T61_00145 [Candidatus Brocadiales bacterium]|nr:hypothetical protein [Candidatus Bathyanammoxibius sp.]
MPKNQGYSSTFRNKKSKGVKKPPKIFGGLKSTKTTNYVGALGKAINYPDRPY